MQVHVAHSFKVKAVGIHEGLGREGKGFQRCHMYLCADACGVLMTQTGNPHQLVRNARSYLGHFPASFLEFTRPLESCSAAPEGESINMAERISLKSSWSRAPITDLRNDRRRGKLCVDQGRRHIFHFRVVFSEKTSPCMVVLTASK